MWTLASTLERIRPALPVALAPGPAFARAVELAQALPAALTDCVYFERWLRHEPVRLDLIVRVGPSGRAVLARGGEAGDPRLGSPETWRRLAAFAEAWGPGGPLDGRIEALWIEFDLAPGSPGPPAPRVFVDFAAKDHAAATTSRRLALEVAGLLLPGGLDPAVAGAFAACFERLPPGATVPYVGLWPSGEPHAVRLCVRGLASALPSYLAEAGWPGDPDELTERVLAPLARVESSAPPVSFLHLDVASGVAPAIGLEYPFARPCQRDGRITERGFLDALVDRDWCEADLRDALLAWPGYSVELLDHEIWHSGVERRVSHVKLACAPGQPVRAKAYLAVLFDLVRGGTALAGRPWRPRAAAADHGAGS